MVQSGLDFIGNPEPSFQRGTLMKDTRWFPHVRMNFGENLLLPSLKKQKEGRGKETVITSYVEEKLYRSISVDELISEVNRLRDAFLKSGIKPGDRVAVCMPNLPETLFIMIAATSLGAIFSSSSPDFGNSAILDRFSQVAPQYLFLVDGYFYKGKTIDKTSDFSEIISGLPGLRKAIVLQFAGTDLTPLSDKNAIRYSEFLSEKESTMTFEKFPFTNPTYIMFSSGTTGLPKCMVQGQGVLLNQVKELKYHLDLKEEETLFYFTTCGWMMWNWMASGLALGSKLVLFDGNPFYPEPSRLWEIAAETKLNVFGTSAGYLSALKKSSYLEYKNLDLSNLRTILSTGSPLLPEQFDFVYENILHTVQLSSISGGTDLNGCFVLGNPIVPVRRGEIQSAGLGMAVEIWNEKGKPTKLEEGELVCLQPFPSMPLFFLNDRTGEKYLKAYFEKYPNVWRHGDFCIQTEEDGFVILGRSDATLNPGGVRIGTSDIYRIVETISEISDSLAVGQTHKGDVRVILFVVMREGREFTRDLEKEIRFRIKKEASPRHVPELIYSAPGIPYTRNLKKVELAVKNILEKKEVSNRESLSNPEILKYYEDLVIPD